MQKILLPTDFSDNAMKAALYAAAIATKNGATVFLLHVIEPVTDSIRQPYPLHEKLQDEITNNRKRELETVQQSISHQYPGIKTATSFAKGVITPAVLDFAVRNQVDLIIMGTKGATGLKEIFMGSVSAETIGRTKVPVLVIPGEYVMEEPDTILFVTNHFEENKDLLYKLVEVAKLFSATIHVAVFVDTETAVTTDAIDKVLQLNHYLHFLRETFPGVAFRGELLEGNDFEETIEKYEAGNEVDMIAMITYPKSFWDRFMKKSATKKMAFHSKIPLLAIPVKQE